MKLHPFFSCCCFLLVGLNFAKAVIFYSSGDPTKNTTAPGVIDGVDATDAWNLQGNFGNFLGTPISSKHFITAKHFGGVIGQTISFAAGANTGSYTTVGFTDSPSSDLRIWEISGTFTQYASLYDKNDENGKSLIVFGRGTQRGSAYLNGSGQTRGWTWGSSDNVKRWGLNEVSALVNSGTLLGAEFNASNNPAFANEGMLTNGDSGGGVFILDGGEWKLAGINFAVDGSYYSNTGVNGSGVQAAIFNQQGLFRSTTNSGFSASPNSPGRFYASRISAEETWITSVIPEPSSGLLVLVGMAAGLLQRRRQK